MCACSGDGCERCELCVYAVVNAMNAVCVYALVMAVNAVNDVCMHWWGP